MKSISPRWDVSSHINSLWEIFYNNKLVKQKDEKTKAFLKAAFLNEFTNSSPENSQNFSQTCVRWTLKTLWKLSQVALSNNSWWVCWKVSFSEKYLPVNTLTGALDGAVSLDMQIVLEKPNITLLCSYWVYN